MKKVKFRTLFIFIVLLALFPVAVFAQETDQAAQESQKLFEALSKMTDGELAILSNDKAAADAAYTEAIKIFNEVLQTSPENLTAIEGIGISKNRMQEGSGAEELKKAVELATKLIEQDGKNAKAYHERATAYRSLKMYDLARADYEKAIELAPENKEWVSSLKIMNLEASP